MTEKLQLVLSVTMSINMSVIFQILELLMQLKKIDTPKQMACDLIEISHVD